jgi:uncharacterized protein YqgV (UPF0045/DUF77 family)
MHKEAIFMSETSCCGAGRNDLPWEGRGASLDISGCRFSLYPMSGGFVETILGALEKTDTSKVYSASDALSTVYRGKLLHVADAVRGVFANAYAPGLHLAMEGQFSKGCPGDHDGDSYLAEDGEAKNFAQTKDIRFPVQCKIALYPLGVPGYIDLIARVFRMAEEAGLSPEIIHYATRLGGDFHAVMDYLTSVCEYCGNNAPHFALTFTLSANSPTEESK